jgi:putative aminopeptidase FrvX
MVGSEIAFLGKAGLLSKKPFNKKLNKLIIEIASQMNIETREFSSMIGSSSDFAPFFKKKLEVCTFTSMKDKQIHSKADTIDKIKPSKLEDSINLIEQLIYKIDKGK